MSGHFLDLVGVPSIIQTHEEDSWGYLMPAAITLPEMLKKSGYQTAIIGKWHFGLTSPTPPPPNKKGLDFFSWFFGDMIDNYWTHRRHDINYMRLNNTKIDSKGHATDIFSDWAIDYISEKADDNNPFFLDLPYNA